LLSKHPKLAKKNDTQPKQGGEEMLYHSHQKPCLEQQEFKKKTTSRPN
jgi:hypothetical protein